MANLRVQPNNDELLHRMRWAVTVQRGLISETEELLTSSSNSSILNGEDYFDYTLVITAIRSHQTHIAKLLIENGFRVYKKSESKPERTVLHAAIETSDDTEFIATLLAKGASQDIFVSNTENKTPFHLAIDRKQLSTIKLFMSQLDQETLNEKNLLHYAVEQDNITIVIELIKEGFSINKRNEENQTPFCVALENKNSKTLIHLLSYYTGKMKSVNPNNYDDIAPVYIASICGYLKLIKKYADLGLSIDRPLMSSSEPWSCLTNCSGYTLLHFAVKYTKLEVVKFLLNTGADITIQNDNESTPLHIAFEIKERGIWETWQDFDDNNSIIDLILKANMKIKSNPVNENRLSHFHVACSRNEPTVVEHFLKHGAVVNQPTKSQCHRYKDFYPLHFAAKFRCKQTLELLLKNGANVNKRDFKKMTALHIAAQESCLDTVRLLLDYGADITSMDSEGNSPVHLAFKNKNYAVIDLLLSIHIEIHSNPTNAEGLSHFHIACTRNNVAVVKCFIENGVPIDMCLPKESDEHEESSASSSDSSSASFAYSSAAPWAKYSPLHFAVCHNRAKIVELLLKRGASVRLKDSKGSTPLHLACQYTHEMFVGFIKTTLHDFSKRGKITLQLRPVTDVTMVFENYFNGFSECTGKIDWSTNRRDHLKIINSLLNYGNDVNSNDNRYDYWCTPVFYAYAAVTDIKDILENNIDDCSEDLLNQIIGSLSEELYERRKLIINNLLKMNVNLNRCYRNGSILHYICSKNSADERDAEMMQLFLENGADVNYNNSYGYYCKENTPLQVATNTVNENLIKILLDYGANVDRTYYANKRTPLLITTFKTIPLISCANIMKILISKGANVNARQLDGKTALHGLSFENERYFSDALVYILLEGGADINSQDNWGYTPLHTACSLLNVEVAQGLLMYGADINVEDYLGCGVCRYMYEFYLKNLLKNRENLLKIQAVIILLQNHVIKMKVLGLPISKKELAACAKFYDFMQRTEEEKKELIDKYEGEVQILRDTKINDYYSLYHVIFQRENELAKLVKNAKFKSLVESKSFEWKYDNYRYLVELKYHLGVDRAKLLPTAKSLLNNLMGLQIPDIYSEMIFSYFTNGELKESIKTMF